MRARSEGGAFAVRIPAHEPCPPSSRALVRSTWAKNSEVGGTDDCPEPGLSGARGSGRDVLLGCSCGEARLSQAFPALAIVCRFTLLGLLPGLA
eukprot:15461221-Alexandrium_andersonii.AAC.1